MRKLSIIIRLYLKPPHLISFLIDASCQTAIQVLKTSSAIGQKCTCEFFFFQAHLSETYLFAAELRNMLQEVSDSCPRGQQRAGLENQMPTDLQVNQISISSPQRLG